MASELDSKPEKKTAKNKKKTKNKHKRKQTPCFSCSKGGWCYPPNKSLSR